METDITDIRVRIDTKRLQAIQSRMGKKSFRVMTNTSLTLLQWALEEIHNGRLIVSVNKDSGDVRQLVMPELLGS